MKFMIPFLMAMLPVASVAQSQPGQASGVPSIAIPKTTEVLVIQTPKQGVTAEQIMAVIPSEIRATVKLYLDGKMTPVVFAGRWQRRHLPGRREDRGRSTSHYGNAAAREGTVDGSPVHSRRTLDAADGTDRPESAAVSLLAIALLQEGNP
jgi:hypothetical protein